MLRGGGSLFPALFLVLPGCFVAVGRPLYPEEWPPLAAVSGQQACPDLSGRYSALSEATPPMKFPPGGQAHEVPWGFQKFAVPALGSAVLPPQLSGVRCNEKSSAWRDLVTLTEKLQEHLTDAVVTIEGDPPAPLRITVTAGTQVLSTWDLTRTGLWRGDRSYRCRNGALEISGAYIISWFEYEDPKKSLSSAGTVGSYFTAQKATDGSLIVHEDNYYCTGAVACSRANMIYDKWWRFLPETVQIE